MSLMISRAWAGGLKPAMGSVAFRGSQNDEKEKKKIESFGKDATGDVDFFQTVLDGKYPNRRLIVENEETAAITDGYPINEGHGLVFTKRPVSSFLDYTDTEVLDWFDTLKDYVRLLKEKLQAKYGENYEEPDFNIGINLGKKAGQTRGRSHTHIIPRYENDVNDPKGPKGGVRGILLDLKKKNYEGLPAEKPDVLFDEN